MMVRPSIDGIVLALLLLVVIVPSSALNRVSVKNKQKKQCTTPEGNCEEDDGDGDGDGNDNDDDDGYAEKEDPQYLDYLNGLEKYEVHEMHEALSEIVDNAGITTQMQRHLERVLIAHQFPNNASIDEEEEEEQQQEQQQQEQQQREQHQLPIYANFGSVLDISTEYSLSWGGSTEFGGKPSWMASLFYRKDIVEHENAKPCRIDLADDYDGTTTEPPRELFSRICHLPVTISDYVALRAVEEKKYEHMELAAYWDIIRNGRKGQWRGGTVMENEFGTKKFDTIIASGVLASEDLQDLDLVMERLKGLLKPGGVVFFVGIEPPKRGGEDDGDEATRVYNQISDVMDSAKGLAWEYPTRNVPASWINRTLHRLGLNVFSSTLFPVMPTIDDIEETVNQGINWIDEEVHPEEYMTPALGEQYKKMLRGLLRRMAILAGDKPVNAGEHQYVIAAELPREEEEEEEEEEEDGAVKESSKVTESTIYRPKPKKA